MKAWRRTKKTFVKNEAERRDFLQYDSELFFDEKKIAKSISIFKSVFAVSSIQKNGICKFKRIIYHRKLNKSFQPVIKTSEVQVSFDSPCLKIEVRWSDLWISTEVSLEIVAIWVVITKIWKESLMKSFPWVGAVEGY